MANRSRQQASRVVVLFSDAEVIVMTGDQAAPLELLAEGLPLEVLSEGPGGEPTITAWPVPVRSGLERLAA